MVKVQITACAHLQFGASERIIWMLTSQFGFRSRIAWFIFLGRLSLLNCPIVISWGHHATTCSAVGNCLACVKDCVQLKLSFRVLTPCSYLFSGAVCCLICIVISFSNSQHPLIRVSEKVIKGLVALWILRLGEDWITIRPYHLTYCRRPQLCLGLELKILLYTCLVQGINFFYYFGLHVIPTLYLCESLKRISLLWFPEGFTWC